MTVLIGGSILLIAASAIALGFGWITADESLIWTSILASVGAGVLLALAYVRSRAEARRPSRSSPPGGGLGDRGEATSDRTSPGTPQPDRPTAVTVATQPPPSRRPSTPAPGKPNSGAPDAEVVAIPDRKKFHRPDCRYARAKGAERISRAAARRRSYDPCGVCKP